MRIMSQTHKLIVQITQVCKEIHDIKTSKLITWNLHQPRQPNSHRGPPSDKHGKGGTGYTHSSNSKSHDRNEDQKGGLHNPEHHASGSPSPPEPPPPEPPEQQSSHASEPTSSSEASASFKPPPSLTEDDSAAS